MKHNTRLAWWLLFCMTMFPLVCVTFFATALMLAVGLWDAGFPFWAKAATPFGFVLLWAEFYVSAEVLDRLA